MTHPTPKPLENEDIFVKDEIIFLAPIKVRLQLMKMIREKFECEELLVILGERERSQINKN
ncbi:MAG: hypothetical protein AABY22_04215 [Nanoarchaeota archaeon]